MKGDFNGTCNVTACTTNRPAIYFNHSTTSYYCSTCANRLNQDSHNKAYALNKWNHNLCTLTMNLEELGKLGAEKLKERTANLAEQGIESIDLFTFTTDCLLGMVDYKLRQDGYSEAIDKHDIFEICEAIKTALEEEYVISKRSMSMEAMGALGAGYTATKIQ